MRNILLVDSFNGKKEEGYSIMGPEDTCNCLSSVSVLISNGHLSFVEP